MITPTTLHANRVIVIGGGVSGLTTAFWLKQKGIDVVVLERAHRPGGLIQSRRESGFLLEHAATCVFNFLPEVDFFCQTLGLSSEMVFRQEAAKRRYLVKDGKPTSVPVTPAGFLTTNLLSFKAKLRLLMEPFIPRGGGEGETVAQFISRRFGREVYERAIEPYVSGTLAGDGEQACLRSTFIQFGALEDEFGSILKGAMVRKVKGIRTSSCQARVFSFKEGMAALPGRVAQQLGEGFQSGCGVAGVERQGTRWTVSYVQDGVSKTVDGDAVVVATPAGDAGRLLQSLSSSLHLLLSGRAYSPMAVTYLGFPRENIDHDLDGIGCLIPKRESEFKVVGSLWPATLFAHRAPQGQALFMNYMGGARDPGVLDRSDEELLARSQQDLKRLVGLKGEPTLAQVIRHDRALPRYDIGHQLFLKGIDESLKSLPGIFLTGNYLHGVSVRACISQGSEVADRVAALLKSSGSQFRQVQPLSSSSAIR
ncbi:MAG: protoporphyrinogen oxidase [Magnetococcales bacterium]|nr:protoporphyrinogen oxidase [Magnetococcales bacterium]